MDKIYLLTADKDHGPELPILASLDREKLTQWLVTNRPGACEIQGNLWVDENFGIWYHISEGIKFLE